MLATLQQLIFEPSALGSDAAQLVLVDMRNCPATSRINLQGTAVDAPAHRLDVRVDRYLVGPYDKVEIPVWFDSDIRAAKPTSIHVTLTHSQLMFKIEEITTTYPDARITTQWSPETVTIDAEGTGPLFGISGPVVVKRGTAYPAIPDSTVIDITSVDVEAEESVSWREQDGLLRVLMCGPYNAIDFIHPTTVQLGAPHPVRDVLELRVVAPAAQSCEIDIVDAAGQTVFANITALLPVGESAVTVPVDRVSSGTYIVRVRTSHGGIFTMPIVILR